jgi:tagatose-6-phosphate ketose/aldose isomerase
MTYLNQNEPDLLKKGALHTAREIACQPALWRETADKFYQERNTLLSFLNTALAESDQIMLTGAGTSAFIGLSLQGSFFSRTKKITRPVATTDMVSHPRDYFRSDQTPLIISFARSGKSPESTAALELADRLCKKCFHLIITCNAEGPLAHYTSSNPVMTFALPPDAHDKSLAMTGSYSSMLLAGLLFAYSADEAFCRRQIGLLTDTAEKILKNDLGILKQVTEKNFKRAVFLGSGPLFGTATEAALKLQELTDGQIICKADTYLGFRHGPKAVIDQTTLVVYFLSNDPYVRQYESDLIKDMKTGNPALFHLGVGEQKISSDDVQAQIILSPEAPVAEDFLPVCSILPAQLLGFYKSLQLGLKPDAPSVSGSISRVVEGVNIYPGAF